MFIISVNKKLIRVTRKTKQILYRALDIDAILNTSSGCIFASGNMICITKTPDTYQVLKQLADDEKCIRLYRTRCTNENLVIHTNKRIIIGKSKYELYDEVFFANPHMIIYRLGADHWVKYENKTVRLFPITEYIFYITSIDSAEYVNIYTIMPVKDVLYQNVHSVGRKMQAIRRSSTNVPDMNIAKSVYVIPRKEMYILTVDGMLHRFVNETFKMTTYEALNAKMVDSVLVIYGEKTKLVDMNHGTTYHEL